MKIQSITSGSHTALYIPNFENKPPSHLFSEWAKAEAERIRKQQIQNKIFSMYSKNIYLTLSLFGVVGGSPPNTFRLYIKVLFSSLEGVVCVEKVTRTTSTWRAVSQLFWQISQRSPFQNHSLQYLHHYLKVTFKFSFSRKLGRNR